MKKYSARLVVVLLFAGSFAAGDNLLAQTEAKAMQPSTAQHKDKSTSNATQVAKDGQAAVRAMHAARVAIFNGEPDIAKKALADAKMLLGKAKMDEMAAKMEGDMIPIDGSLALADSFVASPECTDCIAKANEHFTAGNKSKGIEELRLGEIEVNFSRILMPLAATEKQLMKAIEFADNGKFYECNLALKAAEDGLELDSVIVVEMPSKTKSEDSKLSGAEPDQSNTEQSKGSGSK